VLIISVLLTHIVVPVSNHNLAANQVLDTLPLSLIFEFRYLLTYSANGCQLLANKKLSTNCLSVKLLSTLAPLTFCHNLIISAASDTAISAFANLDFSFIILSLQL
jgi:hypothetical protein